MNPTDYAFLIVAILLLSTVVAGSLSSRFGLPAMIGFLALGMVAGSDGPGGIAFSDYGLAQTIGVACLVFILFSGGLDTDWKLVRPVVAPALVLSTVGVVISAGIVSAAAVLLLDFTPTQGFLLGAVIASTDAAAVFSILRGQGGALRKDLTGLIELESGSNDPMAVFLVGVAVILVATPDASLLPFAPSFLIQMGLGAAVGLGVGFLLPTLIRRMRLRSSGLSLVVSVAMALFSYASAAVVGGNGFLAAYLAGLVAGNREYKAKRTISMFQDGMAWLAQVVMFLALGLLVYPTDLPEVIGPGLAVTAVLMLVARPLSVFICLSPFRAFNWRAKLFISWAGLRGAVPIVLATFPIVAGVPGAQTIFNIVFFVVIVSSLLQGPTLAWLAKKLGVDGGVTNVDLEAAARSVS
ncbi:potassium/proton antiporter [Brevundimonas naejangsanensis]|uniref:potassium/proton antiporter n=1 Tax=Brevundimonas naejangsanensis TaxID=588932 RepID=UPI0026F05EC7|nr:potassium/proton antiporter [Brevundimonas naejangsanensis]